MKMFSLDMKYTSLYWALRFTESKNDHFIKKYDNFDISIQAEQQTVNYGPLRVLHPSCNLLIRHKDFVILECVDRLLSIGYKSSDVVLSGSSDNLDIIVDNVAIRCCRWGEEFNFESKTFLPFQNYEYSILYTSRLVSGLLEYKSLIIYAGEEFQYGVFETGAKPFKFKLLKKDTRILDTNPDFEIDETTLIKYNGNDETVHLPEGINKIGPSAFWDNSKVREIILPQSLEVIGGDAFYYCTNLHNITIPPNVSKMGNNPFAGCLALEIDNQSAHFSSDDGILYDSNKEILIHYPPQRKQSFFSIPNSVICLGKHCFFRGINLKKIKIPQSVAKFENNPFSGCVNISDIENDSLHYIFENGIIYNKYKTQIVGCLNNICPSSFEIPSSVTSIGRNSFWNCNNLNHVTLSENISKIGYNPFAGCSNLLIDCKSSNYRLIDGILVDLDVKEIICCTNKIAKNGISIPPSIRVIGRSAFSGCDDLSEIDLKYIEYIDKSAFSNCNQLSSIYIPDTVKYIGEWAFSHCSNLKTISINSSTIMELNSFSKSPVEIIYRDVME